MIDGSRGWMFMWGSSARLQTTFCISTTCYCIDLRLLPAARHATMQINRSLQFKGPIPASCFNASPAALPTFEFSTSAGKPLFGPYFGADSRVCLSVVVRPLGSLGTTPPYSYPGVSQPWYLAQPCLFTSCHLIYLVFYGL